MATFEVTYDDTPPETLVVGFAAFGLVGLTVVEYLTEQLALEESGHVTADDIPAITFRERLTGPLQSFAVEVEQHYRDLADRMNRVTDADQFEDQMHT